MANLFVILRNNWHDLPQSSWEEKLFLERFAAKQFVNTCFAICDVNWVYGVSFVNRFPLFFILQLWT